MKQGLGHLFITSSSSHLLIIRISCSKSLNLFVWQFSLVQKHLRTKIHSIIIPQLHEVNGLCRIAGNRCRFK